MLTRPTVIIEITRAAVLAGFDEKWVVDKHLPSRELIKPECRLEYETLPASTVKSGQPTAMRNTPGKETTHITKVFQLYEVTLPIRCEIKAPLLETAESLYEKFVQNFATIIRDVDDNEILLELDEITRINFENQPQISVKPLRKRSMVFMVIAQGGIYKQEEIVAVTSVDLKTNLVIKQAGNED